MDKYHKVTALYLAAEKLVGYDTPAYDLHTALLNKVLLKYKNLEESTIKMSLAIEKDFLKFSKMVYNCFEDEGKLTLGLDDIIMSSVMK